jgi:hypothetical protein
VAKKTKYSNLQDPKAIEQLRSELKGKPLIYAFHLNNSTGLSVGSPIEPEIRFYNHLLTGFDSNIHMQNAFIKYGLENFTLYILEFVVLPPDASREARDALMISRPRGAPEDTPPVSIIKMDPPLFTKGDGGGSPHPKGRGAEQHFMDLLKPTYNFSAFAGASRRGTTHTEESKLLMSQVMMGKNVGVFFWCPPWRDGAMSYRHHAGRANLF